jgi:heat shock protein HslJ
MDNAIGTTRPDDPSKYTMRLNGDGTVNMHLNCNLANGTWSAEPSADRSSGSFGFGPLAGTRALCPPPSLDERVVADSKYVRSYLLKNGRLYLSLMADGGIYAWETHPSVPFLTEPDKDLEAAIRQASPYYTKAVVDVEGSTGRGRYVYGRVDLNGDGRDEVFVYLLGSFFCGTGGCNLLLFAETGNGYSLINEFMTARLPVIVSAEKTKGWRNIAWLKSGGGVPSSYLSHIFNGKRYVEGKRMPGDKVPAGKSYLAGELNFYKGIPLEPRD